MEDPSGSLRTRHPHEDRDGCRTPAIEDDHHPLNVWRSNQTRSKSMESDFPLQSVSLEEHFNRLRVLRDHPVHHTMPKTSSPDSQCDPLDLPWRERIKHTTWAYFTLTMATGGLANVLYAIPFRSNWLYYVGLVFFFLNIILYVTIWGMLLTRFVSYPATFRASLVHPTESLFAPAFAVSLGTICITIVQYGADNTGQWLLRVVWVIYWLNVVLSIVLSITIYMILWTSLTFTIAQMTPIWIFPAYPLLIIGPHAANLSGKLESPSRVLAAIISGFTVQGIGFLVSLTIYSAFVYRLMTQKLPANPSRPGMFVSVGPAAFTCSGTIGMASNLPRAIAGYGEEDTVVFMGVPAVLATQILRLVGNWMCLWLWGLAFWFFFVAVISNLAPLYTHSRRSRHKKPHERHSVTVPNRMPFAMTWFSYIFPQTALTTATFRVAEAFNFYALEVIGCVMAGLLVAMWFFVVSMMIRAIVLKQILWPEKGEDRQEGGFVRKRPRVQTKPVGDLES